MKKVQGLCVAAIMLHGAAWAGGKDDEVARTIKACGTPSADRVDSNPGAAGGKERLLQYKGIELSYQKVDGLWVFWGSSLPIGLSNLDRVQTAKNLPCFHEVVGLKGIASPGPVMPKKEYVPPPETQERRVIDPAAESTAVKVRMLRKVVIGTAAAMLLLSLLGWFAMKRGRNDEES